MVNLKRFGSAQNETVDVCSSCMNARGITDPELTADRSDIVGPRPLLLTSSQNNFFQ